MTAAEAKGWNAAIEAMRAIARAAADTIEATGTRPLAEGFAVAALRQIAHDAQHLLLPNKPAKEPDQAPVLDRLKSVAAP